MTEATGRWCPFVAVSPLKRCHRIHQVTGKWPSGCCYAQASCYTSIMQWMALLIIKQCCNANLSCQYQGHFMLTALFTVFTNLSHFKTLPSNLRTALIFLFLLHFPCTVLTLIIMISKNNRTMPLPVQLPVLPPPPPPLPRNCLTTHPILQYCKPSSSAKYLRHVTPFTPFTAPTHNSIQILG